MALEFNAIPKFEDHERFLSKIKISKESECWEWVGYVSKNGYGTMAITGKMYDTKKYFAHRISFSIFKKEITTGLDIDHVCINRKCVNPDHLREVDRKTNLSENTIRTSKLFCKRNHMYTIGSYYVKKSGRDCKQCIAINRKRVRSTLEGKALRAEAGKRYRAKKRLEMVKNND